MMRVDLDVIARLVWGGRSWAIACAFYDARMGRDPSSFIRHWPIFEFEVRTW